jgi:hypothetical protein
LPTIRFGRHKLQEGNVVSFKKMCNYETLKEKSKLCFVRSVHVKTAIAFYI